MDRKFELADLLDESTLGSELSSDARTASPRRLMIVNGNSEPKLANAALRPMSAQLFLAQR